MMSMKRYIQEKAFCISRKDFLQCRDDFMAEMRRGLGGERSSLKMIPAYIDADIRRKKSKRVLAVDMGGTNMRVALVETNPEKMELIYREQYPMPGTKGTLTRESFFEQIATYLLPVVDQVDSIGLCFSFPCEIQPSLDGKILQFNKEISVTDAQGAILGNEINQALKARGIFEDKHIVVINDTVATLLGAQVQAGADLYETYVGFILGTGTNSCYCEKNEQILKSAALKKRPGSSLVNLESGGFSIFPRTDVDQRFDSGTAAPGTQLFEKMISGAYQGGLALAYLKDAAERSVFTTNLNRALLALKSLSPQMIDAFYLNPRGENLLAGLTCTEVADRTALHMLLDVLFQRAAILTICNLAAILEKTQVGKSAEHPVCISAEGSTFYKCKPLHEKIMKYSKEYLNDELGLHLQFVHANESTLLGSALAALCSC